MDVLAGTLRIPIPPLRDYITHVCAVYTVSGRQGHLAASI